MDNSYRKGYEAGKRSATGDVAGAIDRARGKGYDLGAFSVGFNDGYGRVPFGESIDWKD